MTESLKQRRFRALMATFQGEHGYGWQSALAKKIGVTQGLISHIANDKKSPGPDCIEGAIEKMRVSEDFFRDPTIGETPDYHAFVGRSRLPVRDGTVTESRTEYTGTDDYPTAAMREAFLETATGRKTDPDDMPTIFGKRYHGGATLGRIMDFAATILAERRGTAVHEPKQDTPIAENHMPLKPGRKGR